jgi:hypothetical protein
VLARAQDREGQLPVAGPAAVLDISPDQGELDVFGLVQRAERADPERRRVVGDEQDRARHHVRCAATIFCASSRVT